MTRLLRAIRALLRLPGIGAALAVAVRSLTGAGALARRVAALDPVVAGRSGVPAAGTSLPAAAFALEPPSPPPALPLDALPSEATASERRFLYAFFAHVWGGRADVVEVGPFIGGTTRAIALGMLANPLRRPEARLYTYDRFDGYYEPDRLLAYLQPLFDAGALGAAERRAVEEAGSFGEVFDAVHRSTPYAELLERRDRPLPDTPEEATGSGLFALDDGVEVDAIFVDGCKSWYGTRHFMRSVLPAARPGTHVIFQDYGWYTCFWLPAFVHALGDAFELTAWVDSTYAFRLREPVAAGIVDERFPAVPQDLGRGWFDAAFAALGDEAAARRDARERVVLELQHAGALAYLGLREEAAERIRRLRARSRFSELRPTIDAALRAPTYLPGGEPIRL